MKSIQVVMLLAMSSCLATAPVLAQGKGKGGGGGASSAPHGQGVGNGPAGAPGASRAADPERGNDAKPDVGKADRSARPAAQELAGSMHDINQTAFAQRQQLHDTLDMRLKSSRDALKQIQSNAKDLRGDARDQFKASLEVAKAHEKDLNEALKRVHKSNEASWEKDRSALNQAYQNFADSMARLESKVPRPPTPPTPRLP